MEQSWKASRRLQEGNDAKGATVASPTWEGFHTQILAGQEERYEKDTSKDEATSANVAD